MRWADRIAEGLRDAPAHLQRLQAQAIAMGEQGHAMQQQTVGRGAGAAWDPVAFRPPPSEFVKRGTCTSCGGAKELPSVREYLYCDYCGQLTDYDLQRAGQAASNFPTIHLYAQVANELQRDVATAVKRGDRQGHEALQLRLYDAQVEHTPWAVPPRAWNDARFRTRWVDYSAKLATLAAFDRTQVDHAARVKRRALSLQWQGGMGLGVLGGMVGTLRNLAQGADLTDMTPKAVASSFWPLADAVLEQNDHLLDLIRVEGLAELDPDEMRPATRTRLTRSMLVQGWLRHLTPEDGQAFIERMELRHEYQRVQHMGDRASCGGCGSDLSVLPGATRVVCDGCGRPADVAAPQAVCSGCNGRVCFVVGETHQHCPYCRAEMRRV